MPGLEFADVARLVSAEQFAQREMKLVRGRAQCPFHGGEHFNLQFFKDGRCFCHVCHKSADSVQLAAAVWHTSQVEAAQLLNDDFNLGLTGSTPTNEQRQQRQRDREARAAAEQAQRDEWGRLCDEERAAQTAIERYTVDDADTPAFNQALARLCAAQTAVDVMWAETIGG